MIVFHEGLPGAGKSYEAMVERIVPAVAKGRPVVAYVEGIDHAKVAQLATELNKADGKPAVSEEQCRDLVKVLTREDMQQWLTFSVPNALMVFDEAQNFWGNRSKLTKEETQWITEHRHQGIDAILLGQDLRDVHATWRRRVELKLCFLKLNGLGMSSRYSVTTWRHLGGDEYSKLGTTVRKYDPKYFGTYASHVSDDTNTEVYTDKRAQLWNKPAFRYGMPVLLVGVLWGVKTAWGFFHPAPPVATARAGQVHQAAAVPGQPGQPVAGSAAAVPIAAKPAPDSRSPTERRLADLSKQYRIRLAGLIAAGDRFDGYVEWIDAGSRVMERLSVGSLRQMGVGVVRSDGFLRMALGDWSEVATMWPTEAEGRVSENRLEAMRPAPSYAPAPGAYVAAPALSLGGSAIVLASPSK